MIETNPMVGGNEQASPAENQKDSDEQLKTKLLTVIEFIKKANENVVVVNEVGGSIPHEGIGLGGMRSEIASLIGGEEIETSIQDSSFGGQGEKVVSLLREIAAQDLRTGYDSDLIDSNVKELVEIASSF